MLAWPFPLILLNFNMYSCYGETITSHVLELLTICQGAQPRWERALCPIQSACLSLGEQLSSAWALLFLGACFVMSHVVWNGFSKCTKWGLCCINWWETVFGFCFLRDAEGLEEPGQIYSTEGKLPAWCGWLKFSLCCLAGLEGSLPWAFFWAQGCCPRRRSSSWSYNAVPCSSTVASWPFLPSRPVCWGSHALKS